ncbi:hypothetical protein PV08_02724 [Exophiala spinifera]|uniref:FAD-dependent oxidoreductase 2 FAD-binding domain-containing protein n=1 Tax=Exophiala spinifera TaxID=91928 RepID=A0A0D1YT13_9EURO|nr:uncharacterized protein PV08_02724 [Exophiala spinifera]KIW18436.1 hypothetical protein PV08_02724 [Exophiala spinifera]
MTTSDIQTSVTNGMNGSATDESPDEGLNILIVGAGVAGLAAGIGLRKQGHQVQANNPVERVQRNKYTN